MPEQETPRYSERYEVERKLARGGMADVYLAHDLSLDRPVALKVLFPEFATDRNFVERFRREAHSAANLSHPGIVSVYDWGEQGGTYFIVMEYVEGRTLSQILREEGALAPERAAEVTADIAAALGFAHRQGVIHRDVKPGNVLVSPLGQVKVTDFGIARAVSTAENLTQTGTVMGTATYFSPEQARGEGVDPRSDVYSLGVVLYELLVGQPPFTGDSPVAVAYKHVSQAPVPPRQLESRIPVALEAVCMKALAKNAANRYESADDMAADLRRFRDGRPVLAEAVLPVEELTRTVAASPAPTTTVPRVAPTQAVPRTVVDEVMPPRRSPVFVVALAMLLIAVVALLVLLARSLDDGGGTTATVQVPLVVDLPVNEAQARLGAEGLKSEIRQDPESDKPEGTVLAQTPAAGERVEEGGTVQLTVSAAAPVRIPDLRGKTEAEALRTLRELGLDADIQREESDEEEPGRVLRQTPADGGQLPKGQRVMLVIASGPGNAEVPEVVGLGVVEASNQLGGAGFKVRVLREPNDAPKGQVFRQSPNAGAPLEKGETVTIYESEGPAATTSSTSSTSTPTTTTTTAPTTTTTKA